jgi:hypothetical protein
MYADDRVLEPVSEGFAVGGHDDRRPAHLDHARLPWRQDVVDDDARPVGTLHIANLLGSGAWRAVTLPHRPQRYRHGREIAICY